MKIKSIVILALAAVLVVGCDKKKEEKNKSTLTSTGKKSEFPIAQQPQLIDGFTLNGIRINDTNNNLQAVIFLLQPTKKEITTDIKPTNETIGKIVNTTISKIKSKPRNENVKNFLYIQVTKFSQDRDTLRCSFLVKEKLGNNKDTNFYTDSIKYIGK
jgi:hypothetical protein